MLGALRLIAKKTLEKKAMLGALRLIAKKTLETIGITMETQKMQKKQMRSGLARLNDLGRIPEKHS